MKHRTKNPSKHLGRKIMQMRELLGIRQEAVAEKLGVSQQAVSKIEQNENVDDAMMDRVVKALGVNAEAIKDLNEEATVYNIVTNHGTATGLANQNYNCTFNPFDKWAEAIEENKKLYEVLLESERKRIALLEKLLEDKK